MLCVNIGLHNVFKFEVYYGFSKMQKLYYFKKSGFIFVYPTMTVDTIRIFGVTFWFLKWDGMVKYCGFGPA